MIMPEIKESVGDMCACGQKFRHQYLLIRHIRVAQKEICPKCFTTLRSSLNRDGEETLFCSECKHSEKNTATMMRHIQEVAKNRHYPSYGKQR